MVIMLSELYARYLPVGNFPMQKSGLELYAGHLPLNNAHLQKGDIAV